MNEVRGMDQNDKSRFETWVGVKKDDLFGMYLLQEQVIYQHLWLDARRLNC